MLTQDVLTRTLVDAQKNANVCSVFCRVTATISEGGYFCAHNGTGSGDTDAARVYAAPVLALADHLLEPRLVTWLVALHKRTTPRVDLNEAAP